MSNYYVKFDDSYTTLGNTGVSTDPFSFYDLDNYLTISGSFTDIYLISGIFNSDGSDLDWSKFSTIEPWTDEYWRLRVSSDNDLILNAINDNSQTTSSGIIISSGQIILSPTDVDSTSTGIFSDCYFYTSKNNNAAMQLGGSGTGGGCTFERCTFAAPSGGIYINHIPDGSNIQKIKFINCLFLSNSGIINHSDPYSSETFELINCLITGGSGELSGSILITSGTTFDYNYSGNYQNDISGNLNDFVLIDGYGFNASEYYYSTDAMSMSIYPSNSSGQIPYSVDLSIISGNYIPSNWEIYDINWNFEDGGTGSGFDTSHEFPSSGLFTINASGYVKPDWVTLNTFVREPFLNNINNTNFFNSDFYNNGTIQSGYFLDTSLTTGDQYSEILSGNFIIDWFMDALIETASHGIRIYDAIKGTTTPAGSGTYKAEISFDNDSLSAAINPESGVKSGVYDLDYTDLPPGNHSGWFRIVYTQDDSDKATLTAYHGPKDSYEYPESGDWNIISGELYGYPDVPGSGLATWTFPISTFGESGVYISVNQDNNNFKLYEIRGQADAGMDEISLFATTTALAYDETECFIISGNIEGIVQLNSAISYIIFILEPPVGSLDKSILPVLTNKRMRPYIIGNDYLQTRIDVYKDRKISYLPNLPVVLWLNYDRVWQPYASGVTDRYGILKDLQYSTLDFGNIDCCLGIARVTYKDNIYNSNIVRFNFLYGQSSLILDAGTCINPGELDRSSYNIILRDSSNIYDRVYS